jgi:hypothetical protein
MVIGEVAHSWATKKELPTEGNSIILWEQPIHSAAYALTEHLVIPKGQYGAGTTTLDLAMRGAISNPENSKDKFVLTVSGGDRYLFKETPGFGQGAWLFRALGKAKDITPTKEYSMTKVAPNKYLDKVASLVLGGIATHLAQNVGTKVALGSKRVSKYLANSFSEGVHGVVNTSLKAKAARFLTGAGLPDIAMAHKQVHELGRKLAPVLGVATKRQQVGLRMLSQGRISDFTKRDFHKDPLLQKAYGLASDKMKLPEMSSLGANAGKIESVFKDKTHPLASNIVHGISRGNTPIGKNFKPGAMTVKNPLLGAAAIGAADPAAGVLSGVKTLMSSKSFSGTRVGGKINHFLENEFVKKPISQGRELSRIGGVINNLKHKASEFLISPVSAQLKRTSAAISDAIKTH